MNERRGMRIVDESWGAGGHDSTPADWVWIGRWLIVHGVNLLIPRLSFMTIRGTRKTDHPQTFSDHSPWYPYLRPLRAVLEQAPPRLRFERPPATGLAHMRRVVDGS